MSDNNKEIILKITLKEDGNIDVNGPLHNKVLCLGMMEIAKDLVLKYRQVANIVKATQMPKIEIN